MSRYDKVLKASVSHKCLLLRKLNIQGKSRLIGVTEMQAQWEAETLSECDLFSDINNKSWKA